MMKDIFPFSQLGHALTHHYPIDLIHGFLSISLSLPRPSAHASLSLSLFFHLPPYTAQSPVDLLLCSLLYLPHWSLSFPSLNPPSASLCPSTSSQFPPVPSSLQILTPLMLSIHLHAECLFFYIILHLCHSFPATFFLFYFIFCTSFPSVASPPLPPRRHGPNAKIKSQTEQKAVFAFSR